MGDNTIVMSKNALTEGRKRGRIIGEALFSDNEAALVSAMQSRQRHMDVCHAQYGDIVARAYNRGITQGLFDTAEALAASGKMTKELAEAKIEAWVSNLQEWGERATKAPDKAS